MNSLFFLLTLILSAYDLLEHRLPNRLVWSLQVLAVLKDPIGAWASLGGLVLMGSLYLISRSMGLGDVKLFAALAAYTGWEEILPMFVRSFLIAAIFSLILLIKKGTTRKSVIPLGPCLCLAALFSL